LRTFCGQDRMRTEEGVSYGRHPNFLLQKNLRFFENYGSA